MACSSCASAKPDTSTFSTLFIHPLWIALAVNGSMVAAEMVAGIAGGSKALQADALDFLSDVANHAISLGVADLALNWRARLARPRRAPQRDDARASRPLNSRNDDLGSLGMEACLEPNGWVASVSWRLSPMAWSR